MNILSRRVKYMMSRIRDNRAMSVNLNPLCGFFISNPAAARFPSFPGAQAQLSPTPPLEN